VGKNSIPMPVPTGAIVPSVFPGLALIIVGSLLLNTVVWSLNWGWGGGLVVSLGGWAVVWREFDDM
jgi:hypothetical protein